MLSPIKPALPFKQRSLLPGAVDLPNVRVQLPIKGLAANGHLELIEGVLHDVVRVQVVDPTHGNIHVGLHRVGEEQEFGAGQGVEALQPEVLGLEDLESRRRLRPAWYRHPSYVGCRLLLELSAHETLDWVKPCRDSMDSVGVR